MWFTYPNALLCNYLKCTHIIIDIFEDFHGKIWRRGCIFFRVFLKFPIFFFFVQPMDEVIIILLILKFGQYGPLYSKLWAGRKMFLERPRKSNPVLLKFVLCILRIKVSFSTSDGPYIVNGRNGVQLETWIVVTIQPEWYINSKLDYRAPSDGN